jgi:hypothetical protein
MENPEVPLESVHEDIHHHAAHSGESWTLGVALSTAFIAGFAAVASLAAGHHANEAMLDQMKASDQWAYYQSKSIKAGVLRAKDALLDSLGKPHPEDDAKKLEEYEGDQDKIKEAAEEHQKASQLHLLEHTTYARSVTMFQVAIAVAAIAVLTKRKWFWFGGMLFGLIGLFFMVQAAFFVK